jgi:hypothetical protein
MLETQVYMVRGVLSKTLASVVSHAEKIQQICPANSKIFQNLLFRDPTILPRLKLALNDDMYSSPQIVNATGLPPHVAVLKKLNKMDIDVKNAIMKAFEEYGIGQPNVTKRWTTQRFQGLDRRFDQLVSLMKSSSFSRSPSSTLQLRSPLPINYKMPNVKFQTGWSYWLFGDPAKKVPPFQFLKGNEFNSKTCRAAFRSYRKVMLRVEKEVLKVHRTVNFKRDFKASNIVTNVANVHKADEYFEVGSTAMVGNANNGKYIAKTETRYKSKPVGELSISTVRRRLSPYVVTNATTSTTGTSSEVNFLKIVNIQQHI